MSFQNQVDPFGTIHTVPGQRGLLMGNRGGSFHTNDQRLKSRHWASKQWIACDLNFKGRHRELMQPGRYTELFFLDDPTALAAGHRPCFECRRADALRFREAWPHADKSVRAIDAILHAERMTAKPESEVSSLPDGVMVELLDDPGNAWLKWDGALLLWSFKGYGTKTPVATIGRVRLLTPASIAAVLRLISPRTPFGE